MRFLNNYSNDLFLLSYFCLFLAVWTDFSKLQLLDFILFTAASVWFISFLLNLWYDNRLKRLERLN